MYGCLSCWRVTTWEINVLRHLLTGKEAMMGDSWYLFECLACFHLIAALHLQTHIVIDLWTMCPSPFPHSRSQRHKVKCTFLSTHLWPGVSLHSARNTEPCIPCPSLRSTYNAQYMHARILWPGSRRDGRGADSPLYAWPARLFRGLITGWIVSRTPPVPYISPSVNLSSARICYSTAVGFKALINFDWLG